MKKAYIIIGVIALIAIGLFGTAAANPDATQSIVQKLDTIISGIAGIDEEMDTNMTALKNDLDSIKSDIEALKETKSDVSDVKTIVGSLETTVGMIDTSISTISSDIDLISNSVVKMEVGSDYVTGNNGVKIAESPSDDQLAHSSI